MVEHAADRRPRNPPQRDAVGADDSRRRDRRGRGDHDGHARRRRQFENHRGNLEPRRKPADHFAGPRPTRARRHLRRSARRSRSPTSTRSSARWATCSRSRRTANKNVLAVNGSANRTTSLTGTENGYFVDAQLDDRARSRHSPTTNCAAASRYASSAPPSRAICSARPIRSVRTCASAHDVHRRRHCLQAKASRWAAAIRTT